MKYYRTLGYKKAHVHKQDSSWRVACRGSQWHVQRKEPRDDTQAKSGWYDTGKPQDSIEAATKSMYSMHPLKGG